MTVLILVAAPPGLRGHLTRWFIEMAPGVFVGNASRRVRDRLWDLIIAAIGGGQAIMVEPASNEQHWSVRTAGKDRWFPVEWDGLVLAARPKL
ncbi:MAG: type I-E CRISPR-associated endoribonuclease Cas2e [Bifidobacteriaceae bacterium]|jgi:CRISPR-associated protein Cas2|nr:type I-E CRISPR-associated endoribonuclease Cas2e [Bifidobacteriaceae bacterium]